MAYVKVLVARYSPKNLCFAPESELLVPAAPTDKMGKRLPKDDHFFVGIETGLPSRYGWVKDTTTLVTAEELARMRKGSEAEQEAIDRCELLLKTIAKLPEGTPVACHFMEVTFPEAKYRKLKIHRVFFHSE